MTTCITWEVCYRSHNPSSGKIEQCYFPYLLPKIFFIANNDIHHHCLSDGFSTICLNSFLPCAKHGGLNLFVIQ